MVISRSRAGVSLSRYLATESLSLQWMITVSPRISTESAPLTRPRDAASAPASVARTVRPEAIALTSAAVPSATFSPCETSTMRSA